MGIYRGLAKVFCIQMGKGDGMILLIRQDFKKGVPEVCFRHGKEQSAIE